MTCIISSNIFYNIEDNRP